MQWKFSFYHDNSVVVKDGLCKLYQIPALVNGCWNDVELFVEPFYLERLLPTLQKTSTICINQWSGDGSKVQEWDLQQAKLRSMEWVCNDVTLCLLFYYEAAEQKK